MAILASDEEACAACARQIGAANQPHTGDSGYRLDGLGDALDLQPAAAPVLNVSKELRRSSHPIENGD